MPAKIWIIRRRSLNQQPNSIEVGTLQFQIEIQISIELGIGNEKS